MIGHSPKSTGVVRYTFVFGDIQPQQYLEKQPKYGNLLRRRHFAAKKRPAGDTLASSECINVFLVCIFVHRHYVRYSNGNAQTRLAMLETLKPGIHYP